MKPWLKWTLKIGLSGLALYLIFRKISWEQTWKLLSHANFGWLFIAFVFFNISQILSAKRALCFYRTLGIPLDYFLNLKLYYKGMFYNLFLPGGIGGDGYKVHFLYKAYHKPVKKLVSATLIDRLNGLALLGFLIALLGSIIKLPKNWLPFPNWGLIVIFFIGFGICIWILHKLFPVYIPIIFKTSIWSLGIQILQLISVFFIIRALHIEGDLLAYFLLFLLSSVAAVIPFTIGGAGAREIVFVAGAPLLGVISTEAVAISLLFFILTAIASFIGIVIKIKKL
ncbi:MAG TPA: lysylphosphatidylglycerol synthase transmembrane domain-containing protein [Chitinophagaceae bacterium]|nr:lysylphosphatidylglycerol synthase transmembrane domain-containing protein [Chitinophagaceae bacterium]